MFKKYFSLLLCLTLMLCASLAAAEYTPGTYEGTAAGFGGDITAKVTVTENETVSGCTFSSQGILNAVKAALLAAGADEIEITKKVEAAPSEPKETLEYTADVVIIGAGGAGMSAALEAKQAGADVIVLEKTASVGGNTIVAGSALNCADPENRPSVRWQRLSRRTTIWQSGRRRLTLILTPMKLLAKPICMTLPVCTHCKPTWTAIMSAIRN